MFVSVIFDGEYMGMASRIKWFIKNLSHALENNCLIITHEYLGTHFKELMNSCAERFFDEFEMRHLSDEEMQKVDVCYVPDSFFENLYKESGTRSKMILELTNHRFNELEDYIEKSIKRNLVKRHEEKVDAIFNCTHCFKSISYIADRYKCPIIPYVLSAIRKMHGYQQTLYMANMSADFVDNDEVKSLYSDFKPEELGFELFTNEEILALLGKKKNLPLLPLLRQEGEYEIGIAKESFSISPQVYTLNYTTDDDLYYECKRWYKDDEIVSRMHPDYLDRVGLGRKHMKNDPITFILSCKRIATNHSLLIMKAAMWNRVPCVLSNGLPHSFLFTNDFRSGTPVSMKELNFIIFCYFIPSSCMFDRKYWIWRQGYPTANEIMCRHLEEILKNLGYADEILCDKQNRLSKILQKRGCDKYLTDYLLEGRLNASFSYQNLLSRIRIHYSDDIFEDRYCMNKTEGEIIFSEFKASIRNRVDYCLFYPFDDVDGKAKILDIKCNKNRSYN